MYHIMGSLSMTIKMSAALLASTLLLSASLSFSGGQFINSGTMSGRVLTMGSRNMQADGSFIGKEEVRLTCTERFAGSGYVQAPVVVIKASKFEFTGTITCDVSCDIIVKEPFNEKMFTRKGTGTFTITVDPELDL